MIDSVSFKGKPKWRKQYRAIRIIKKRNEKNNNTWGQYRARKTSRMKEERENQDKGASERERESDTSEWYVARLYGMSAILSTLQCTVGVYLQYVSKEKEGKAGGTILINSVKRAQWWIRSNLFRSCVSVRRCYKVTSDMQWWSKGM